MLFRATWFDNVEDEWCSMDYRYWSQVRNTMQALGHNPRYTNISFEEL